MAVLKISWQHNMNVRIEDAETTRQMFEQQIFTALELNQSYSFAAKQNTCIVPAPLLQTAIIDISE